MKRSAFTLIECLVTVVILCSLAALLLPVVNRTIKNAKMATSLSNIRQSGNAILLFTTENNNQLPSAYGSNVENIPNWVIALRDAGYSNAVGTSNFTAKNMICPMALACRPASRSLGERMFAMNYFASRQSLASFDKPSQTALIMNGRWNPSGKNWGQTEVGAGNGGPNHLPDFPFPIRTLTATDHPQAKADNPSTVVFFLDGHSSLISKKDFPDSSISTNTYTPFWGRK